MDLRTGTPVWLADSTDELRYPRLIRNARCDVAVIGAGITGALVAHRLIEAGLRVVVLEKRSVGRGSTAASTGLLLYQTDTSLKDLSRLHGEKSARRIYQLGRTAIRDLARLAQEIDARCDFRRRPTLYVASKPGDTRLLKEEARRARRIHFKTTRLSSAQLEKQFHLRRSGALRSTDSAELNAYQFTQAIFRHHQEDRRLRVFQHSVVAKLEETRGRVVLRLANGAEVHAGHVVVASGYEAGRFIQSDLVRLQSTYVIASPPMRPEQLWQDEALIWETSRPYFYLRTTRDHRIVFGGRDDPFMDPVRRDRRLRRKTRELEADFAKLFPALAFRAEYAWTGTFAETCDGLPCIGRARENSRILFALGYGGNGITFSQIAATLLRDLCLGRANVDTKLFRFDRSGAPPPRQP